MGAGKKKPAAFAGRPKSAPASSGAAPAPAAAVATRALAYSVKAKKGGRQLEVSVQIPRSTPDSVLNVNADESGLRVDTGTWGGGYACQMEWPAQYAGKVRAGKDIEIEAQLNPGRLLMFFDLEKPDGAPAAAGARAEADEDERITGKKRARDEPGPNKKKREKAKEKKKTNEMKKKKSSAPEHERQGGAAATSEPPATKKQKRLVEDKKDVLAFVESVGGAKEAETEWKLANERARNEKMSKLKEKQEQRKADKIGRKEKLKAALKTQVQAGKAQNAKGSKSVAAETEPQKPEKKRRVSWGVDQEREFES